MKTKSTAPSVTADVMSLADSASFESKTYAKVGRRLIPFLMLCYLGAYLDRVNVGFAKLQMLNDLRFSETVYGFGAGIFFLGYFLFEVPSNLMLHKVGARNWLARIMLTWAVISACFVFVKSPTTFYVLRFLLGVAEAGFAPGVILYLTYWFPAARRAKALSLFFMAIPLAGIVGGPLSGYIMHAFQGVHGLAGWKWLFILEALPSLRPRRRHPASTSTTASLPPSGSPTRRRPCSHATSPTTTPTRSPTCRSGRSSATVACG